MWCLRNRLFAPALKGEIKKWFDALPEENSRNWSIVGIGVENCSWYWGNERREAPCGWSTTSTEESLANLSERAVEQVKDMKTGRTLTTRIQNSKDWKNKIELGQTKKVRLTKKRIARAWESKLKTIFRQKAAGIKWMVYTYYRLYLFYVSKTIVMKLTQTEPLYEAGRYSKKNYIR